MAATRIGSLHAAAQLPVHARELSCRLPRPLSATRGPARLFLAAESASSTSSSSSSSGSSSPCKHLLPRYTTQGRRSARRSAPPPPAGPPGPAGAGHCSSICFELWSRVACVVEIANCLCSKPQELERTRPRDRSISGERSREIERSDLLKMRPNASKPVGAASAKSRCWRAMFEN